jgi:uncharacterized integral membrane protein (TIGR00697 family)
MQENITGSDLIGSHPHFLWFLTLAYSMMIVLANWFDPWLIRIFGLLVDAGMLIFPLTFLLSGIITEVYGYKYARRAIWSGFLFNLLFIIYGQTIIHIPSPEYFVHNNAAIDTLLSIHTRIMFASGISYFSSEPLNSFILAKLKTMTKGHYMNVRFVLSALIAVTVNTATFNLIAFYGTMDNSALISITLAMWLIIIVCLPISIHLAQKLKQLEQWDIYDKRTIFNIFSLEANYATEDNEFDQHEK